MVVAIKTINDIAKNRLKNLRSILFNLGINRRNNKKKNGKNRTSKNCQLGSSGRDIKYSNKTTNVRFLNSPEIFNCFDWSKNRKTKKINEKPVYEKISGNNTFESKRLEIYEEEKTESKKSTKTDEPVGNR